MITGYLVIDTNSTVLTELWINIYAVMAGHRILPDIMTLNQPHLLETYLMLSVTPKVLQKRALT